MYTTDVFHYFLASDKIVNQQGVEIGGEFVSSFNTSYDAPTPDIDSLVPFRGQVQTPLTMNSLRIYYNRPGSHRYVTVFSLSGDTVVNDTVTSLWDPGSVPITGLLPKTYYIVRISDDPGFNGSSDYMSSF